MTTPIRVRHLGLMEYATSWAKMRDFTLNRHATTLDECWLVEHYPIYTQGQAGKAEHILNAGEIPVLQTDRGGQVTYHGPGQIVIYLLIDLKRKSLGIKPLINTMEKAIIDLLASYQIVGFTKPNAPGVYIADAKIASLGLRVRKGCSYHGLSLNVAMDLAPFQHINPCGYPNLKVVQLQDFVDKIQISEVRSKLLAHLIELLDYTVVIEPEQHLDTQPI